LNIEEGLKGLEEMVDVAALVALADAALCVLVRIGIVVAVKTPVGRLVVMLLVCSLLLSLGAVYPVLLKAVVLLNVELFV
jgi:hypothetical protein